MKYRNSHRNNYRKTKKRGGFNFEQIKVCPKTPTGKKMAQMSCAQKYAIDNGLIIVKTADDGNCFYDTLYIYGIFLEYEQYNMCIYSTRRLMLRRRAGSHSTGSTSNDTFFHCCKVALCKHLGFLAKWTRRARLELKIAGECHARQARHKQIILDLSHPYRLSFLS
jgi:hypothetical protein